MYLVFAYMNGFNKQNVKKDCAKYKSDCLKLGRNCPTCICPECNCDCEKI